MSQINIASGKYVLTGNPLDLDLGDKPLGCTGEWMSLADAMTMLGAEVGEEDAVQQLMDELSALISEYLYRDLPVCTHTDSFFRPDRQQIYLSNWPVTEWTSIRVAGQRVDMSNYELDAQLGVLYNKCGTNSRFVPCDGLVTVNYDAGYSPPPLELQSMFRAILVDYYSSGGSTEGSVGSIKKVSLTGVAAVEFNNDGISYSGVDRQLGVPGPLKNYVGMLNKYLSDRTMAVV